MIQAYTAVSETLRHKKPIDFSKQAGIIYTRYEFETLFLPNAASYRIRNIESGSPQGPLFSSLKLYSVALAKHYCHVVGFSLCELHLYLVEQALALKLAV